MNKPKLIQRLFVVWARSDSWHKSLAAGLLIWFLVALWCAGEARYQGDRYRTHMIQHHTLPQAGRVK